MSLCSELPLICIVLVENTTPRPNDAVHQFLKTAVDFSNRQPVPYFGLWSYGVEPRNLYVQDVVAGFGELGDWRINEKAHYRRESELLPISFFNPPHLGPPNPVAAFAAMKELLQRISIAKGSLPSAYEVVLCHFTQGIGETFQRDDEDPLITLCKQITFFRSAACLDVRIAHVIFNPVATSKHISEKGSLEEARIWSGCALPEVLSPFAKILWQTASLLEPAQASKLHTSGFALPTGARLFFPCKSFFCVELALKATLPWMNR